MPTRSWEGPQIILREPWRAAGRRLTMRAGVVIAALAIGGVPRVWSGVVPWPALRGALWAVAGVALLLLALSVANLARNRRALLVQHPSGVIERPPSVQEGWLRRPREWVEGADVLVTESIPSVIPSRADPRVTISVGERAIPDVPLWGVDPDVFVMEANSLLAGRGTRLRHRPPPSLAD